ncbi:hypothetical protein HMF8227_01426 [Saliniradius amylolyticus]|uniref:Glutaredoxin-like protein n=1 Tax=Saliniradius amylolyticus TaxID=2183582 RepID=A0A2S2E2M8_9ALTE|nr:glutaredoxin family protein [Saliniradius amylolyticus]AWL11901.1 hypothetical protein HMF8227_01426 [Saliniradius amylolyticus]
MVEYTLYSTEGCHLCEQALDLIKQSAPEAYQALQVQDIAYDDALYECYKWSIPVLKASSGKELRWPFDGEQLKGFVR